MNQNQPQINISRFDLGSVSVSIAKILGVFIVLFAISFVVLNFPALWIKLSFATKTPEAKQALVLKYPPVATQLNHLVIPRIGVDAPIEWNIAEDNIYTALENGVVQYENTAYPGNFGNVFIFGHSSYYLWAPGQFKQIFALLDKLEVSDRIYVNYQNKVYGYEVTGKKVVEPTDLSVLNQPQDQKILTLMTCVPIGTSRQRLIIAAKEINL